MNISSLANAELSVNNIYEWPRHLQLAVSSLLAVVVLVAGYFLVISGQFERLNESRAHETGLKEELEQKQMLASNFDAYQEQNKVLRDMLNGMLQQLPGKAEIAKLLVDISQAGIGNGLEFQLFKPQHEQIKEFYAELPIQIRVVGSYHQFGNFISDVAALSRIVTLENISVRKAERSDTSPLVMELTARTYRYLSEKEQAEYQKAQKQKEGKK
ncbi:MAG TPA: pilus assembly protein PilO [Gammaproteobacteria bacterium]|nr:pilus assembly protein PilO [Gammaproteobacteria bacterium]